MTFMSYLKHYDEIEGVFKRHDTDNSGFLNREQLISLLTELNEGLAPVEEEVTRVLDLAAKISAGQVSKPGLVKAISEWYVIEDEKAAKEAAVAGPANSACCVVS